MALIDILNTATKIAPHLQAILQSIIAPHNSANPSADQWSILQIDLSAYADKLKRLGAVLPSEFFDLMRKQINLPRISELLMAAVSQIHDFIKKGVFNPLMRQMFLNASTPMPHDLTEFLEKCKNEIAPSKNCFLHVSTTIGEESQVIMNARHILRDGELALARMHPDRILSKSGSLRLRDINPFVLFMTQEEIDSLSEQFSHYDVKHQYDITPQDVSPVYLTNFEPKQNHLDDEITLKLYNKKMDQATILDIIMGKPSLDKDINFGPKAIYNKLIGSAISSLDFTLELYCLVGGMIYEKRYPGEGISRFRSRFVTSNMPDIMMICDPTSLREYLSKGLSQKVLSDTHTLIQKEIRVMTQAITTFNMYHDVLALMFHEPISTMTEMDYAFFLDSPNPSAPQLTYDDEPAPAYPHVPKFRNRRPIG